MLDLEVELLWGRLSPVIDRLVYKARSERTKAAEPREGSAASFSCRRAKYASYLVVFVSVAMIAAAVGVAMGGSVGAAVGLGMAAMVGTVSAGMTSVALVSMRIIAAVLVVAGAVVATIIVFTAVVPSAAGYEAVVPPSMAIAPVGPGAYTQENTVIEVTGSVIARGRASIGSVAVIAVGADRRTAADVDAEADLRVTWWREGHRREHSGGTE
jgi:hypothetical protein